jgi:hypothetical protein
MVPGAEERKDRPHQLRSFWISYLPDYVFKFA